MGSGAAEDWRQTEVCLFVLHAASHELMEGALPRARSAGGNSQQARLMAAAVAGGAAAAPPQQPDPTLAPALNSVFAHLAQRAEGWASDRRLEQQRLAEALQQVQAENVRGVQEWVVIPPPLLATAARVVGSFARFLAAAHEASFRGAAAEAGVPEILAGPDPSNPGNGAVANPQLQPPYPLDGATGGGELRGCVEVVLMALHTVGEPEGGFAKRLDVWSTTGEFPPSGCGPHDKETAYDGAIALANLLAALPSADKPAWWNPVGLKQRCGLLLSNPQGMLPDSELLCTAHSHGVRVVVVAWPRQGFCFSSPQILMRKFSSGTANFGKILIVAERSLHRKFCQDLSSHHGQVRASSQPATSCRACLPALLVKIDRMAIVVSRLLGTVCRSGGGRLVRAHRS